MTLVGRAFEFNALTSIMLRPNAKAALITGSAGIGKTTLLQAAARDLGEHSTVIAGRGWAGESDLPFAALATMFKDHHHLFGKLPGPQRSALESACALREATPSPAPDAAVGWAVKSLLEHVASQSPTILVIDDVQELDVPSASALSFALRRMPHSPFGVIMAWRTGTTIPARFVDCLPEGRLALNLQAMNLGDIATLVYQRLGIVLGGERLRIIGEKSAGNPWAALEFARAERDGRPPETLSSAADALAERLRNLPLAARTLLTLIAAAGRLSRASADTILDPDDVGVALAQTADAGLVHVDHDGTIGLHHPLFGSGVLVIASPDQRRQAHSLLARCELLGLEQRARHVYEASPPGPDAAAADILHQAADSAARRHASWTAGELAHLALRKTPPSDVEAQVARGLLSARMFWAAAANDRAGDVLNAIEPIARGTARAEWLLRAAENAGNDVNTAIPLLQEAIAIPEVDPVTRLMLKVNYGGRLLRGGRLTEARDVMTQTEQEATTLGIPDLAAGAASARYLAELFSAAPEAETTFERLQSMPVSPMLDASYYGPKAAAVARAHNRGENALARMLLTELIAHAIELGIYREATFMQWWLVVNLVWDGHIEQAQDLLADVRHFEGAAYGELVSAGVIAVVAAHTGDVDTVRACAKSEAFRRYGFVLPLIGSVRAHAMTELALGNIDGALAGYREVRDIANAHGIRLAVQWTNGVWHADFVEAALAAGATDEAHHVRQELQDLADLTGYPYLDALARRCAALAEATQGRTKQALDILEALVHRETDHTPIEYARTLLTYGLQLRRDKQRAKARTVLLEAADRFTLLHHPIWSQRAATELERAGFRADDNELTYTEQRIAALVAEGYSNPDVAKKLNISVKTVEGYLTSIFRKLGVHSRLQLAALWAKRRTSEM